MEKHKTIANTIANMASKIWSMVSIYIFVPLYIKYLGEEAYGLISFFTTMQMALNLLGLGLSSTLRREFALNINGGYEVNLRKYKLLRSIEVFFTAIAIMISVVCCSGAQLIAEKWLDSSVLGIRVVATTVGLMGISIALQLLSQLYFGAMLGLARQVLANGLNVLYAALKAVGSVLIIMFFYADIRAFYTWHIVTDIVYICVLRIILIQSISGTGALKWKFSDFWIIKDIWKYALGLVTISMVAFVNKQLDRIVISKFMTLTELGAYNSCYTLGQIVTIISSAVATAIFSEFTDVYSKNGTKEELQKLYVNSYKIVVIIASSIGVFVAAYSKALLLFWTQSESYVSIMERGAGLIVIGTMILAFQEIPYAFVLAQGNTSINRKMGLYFLLPFIISMYIGVKRYGVMGAAIVYFSYMAIQTSIYIYVIYKKYCIGNVFKWIIKDTLLPAGVSVFFAVCSQGLARLIGLNGVTEIIFAVMSGGITLCILIFIFDRKIIHSKMVRR